MSILVTERRTPIRFSRGNFAAREFDITGVSNAAEAQQALVDQKGIAPGVGHPLDEFITIPSDGIEIAQHGMGYRGKVSYRGTPGFSGGVESLLAQKWRISVSPSCTEEPIDRVFNGLTPSGKPKFKPLVNSSRQPILGITQPLHELMIEMWRYEATYELDKHLEYSNTWNANAVVLPKLGVAAAGELSLLTIQPAEEMTADSPVAKIVYRFKARPRIYIGSNIYHGFNKRIHDTGTRVYVSGGTFEPITLKSDRSHEAETDIPLDGHGALHSTMTGSYDGRGRPSVPGTAPTILDETDSGVFLLYDTTFGPRDYAGLNIGANL